MWIICEQKPQMNMIHNIFLSIMKLHFICIMKLNKAKNISFNEEWIELKLLLLIK